MSHSGHLKGFSPWCECSGPSPCPSCSGSRPIWTMQGHLAPVDSPVLGELRQLRVGLTALVTPVHPLVGPHGAFQKNPVTLRALEGPLPAAGSHVLRAVGVLAEAPAALGTGEGLFSGWTLRRSAREGPTALATGELPGPAADSAVARASLERRVKPLPHSPQENGFSCCAGADGPGWHSSEKSSCHTRDTGRASAHCAGTGGFPGFSSGGSPSCPRGPGRVAPVWVARRVTRLHRSGSSHTPCPGSAASGTEPPGAT